MKFFLIVFPLIFILHITFVCNVKQIYNLKAEKNGFTITSGIDGLAEPDKVISKLTLVAKSHTKEASEKLLKGYAKNFIELIVNLGLKKEKIKLEKIYFKNSTEISGEAGIFLSLIDLIIENENYSLFKKIDKLATADYLLNKNNYFEYERDGNLKRKAQELRAIAIKGAGAFEKEYFHNHKLDINDYRKLIMKPRIQLNSFRSDENLSKNKGTEVFETISLDEDIIYNKKNPESPF